MRRAAEALNRGEFSVSHDLARRLTEGAPEFEDGWMMLTEALAGDERYQEGMQAIDDALAVHPGSVPLRIQRCKFLLGLGQRSECLEQVRSLVTEAGENAWALDQLAMYYSLLDQVDDSSALYEKLCQLEPGNPDNHVNLGMTRLAQGRFEQARACAEDALKRVEGYPRALSLLANLGTASPDHHHVSSLQAALNAHRPLPEKVTLGFALGKELEDLGRWDEAFQAYRAAGEAKRRMEPYDHEQINTLVNGLMAHQGADFFQSGGQGSASSSPIFIVGMPRSGTTLVEQILGRHDEVYAAGELRDFMEQVALAVDERPGSLISPAGVEASAGLDYPALGDAYVQAVSSRTGDSPRFTDKRPLNFMYLGMIARALPQAGLVHVTRNPMDVIFSNFKVLFGYLNSYSYNVKDAARYYVAYHRLMQHWQALMPERIFTLKYEDLVEDPGACIPELIERLGLSWQEECLAPHAGSAAVSTASAAQVRKPIYRSAIGHWRHFEQHLGGAMDILDEAGIPYR
jgi:tetratricopeptide (TPR) repeat protein